MFNECYIQLQCRGFWFNYPDFPLLPDSFTGNAYMLNKEARFTAIHQFDDNTAHSNGGVSYCPLSSI